MPHAARHAANGPADDVRGPRKWRRVFWRSLKQMGRHRMSVIAAGVAFYALLALFPALAALIGLYGLAFDPQQVARQIESLGALLPGQALDIIVDQVKSITASRRTLTLGAAGALLFTLWSASRAVKMLIEALNFAYGEREKRGFVKLNGLALLLTLGLIVGAAMTIAAVVAVPIVFGLLGLDSLFGKVLSYVRWPVLAVAMVLALGVVYRLGPDRKRTKTSWLSVGAVIATLLWLAGSWLFSLYVASFGRFNETYGSMGAVVVLLMWFLFSVQAILLGAEVDAALERRAGHRHAVSPSRQAA